MFEEKKFNKKINKLSLKLLYKNFSFNKEIFSVLIENINCCLFENETNLSEIELEIKKEMQNIFNDNFVSFFNPIKIINICLVAYVKHFIHQFDNYINVLSQFQNSQKIINKINKIKNFKTVKDIFLLPSQIQELISNKVTHKENYTYEKDKLQQEIDQINLLDFYKKNDFYSRVIKKNNEYFQNNKMEFFFKGKLLMNQLIILIKYSNNLSFIDQKLKSKTISIINLIENVFYTNNEELITNLAIILDNLFIINLIEHFYSTKEYYEKILHKDFFSNQKKINSFDFTKTLFNKKLNQSFSRFLKKNIKKIDDTLKKMDIIKFQNEFSYFVKNLKKHSSKIMIK
jgi:hypothetical protein